MEWNRTEQKGMEQNSGGSEQTKVNRTTEGNGMKQNRGEWIGTEQRGREQNRGK